jgi:uncharacterized membrane protein
MIVHFPVALLPMDIGFNAAGKFFNNPTMFHAAYYCLITGVILGWIAIGTGLLDLFSNIIKHGKEVTQRAYIHGTVQSVVVTGFTLIASAEYKNPDLIAAQPTWMWLTKGLLVIVLFVGNHLGGELVLRYVSRDFHG